jgi:hypothetical protein
MFSLSAKTPTIVPLTLSGDPDSLQWATAATLGWFSARKAGRPFHCAFEDSRFGPWLDWLTIEWIANRPGGAAPPTPAMEGTLSELRSQGLLGEVVLSALVQSRWPRQRQRLECLSRSELLVYFDPEQISPEVHPFPNEEILRINRDRLHELPPRQVLEASVPYWAALGGPSAIPEEHACVMEAWLMVHVDQLGSLLDVPNLIGWAWSDPEPLPTQVPSNWAEDPGALDEVTRQHLLSTLVGPNETELDLASTVAILGPDFCRARIDRANKSAAV